MIMWKFLEIYQQGKSVGWWIWFPELVRWLY